MQSDGSQFQGCASSASSQPQHCGVFEGKDKGQLWWAGQGVGEAGRPAAAFK